MFTDFPILSITIWLPIIGGIWIVFRNTKTDSVQGEALGFSVVTFFLSLILLYNFDYETSDMQFVEKIAWIPVFGIDYFVGLDGISLPLILLTTFITIVIVLATGDSITDRPGFYLGSFLILEGVMVGVFSALDAVLFYVFWEAMLIPMFLIIGIWGGENRVYATIKFFLYTLLGSLLMLVALLYLYFVTGSFSIEDMHVAPLGLPEQQLLFLAFLFAFAVKVPMWPVHTWLPDAHVEAPTAGSVILAGVLLKMGAYGFLRFSVPMLPYATEYFTPLIYVLSIIAIIYTSLVALAQEDMKKLIAYSSVAHMGFVTIGIFTLTQQGVQGAIIQMISHGFVSGALFLCVGVLYDRIHSREIKRYGGLVERMPKYAFVFMVFMLASVGLPGTSGFVGEFLILVGAFKANTWVAALATTGIILGAAYMLYLYRRVVFGKLEKKDLRAILDLSPREIAIFTPLVAVTIWMGVWPAPFLDVIDVSVSNLLQQHELAMDKLQSITVVTK